MNAVELLRAKAGNYTAEYGENIVGNAKWKNLVIDAGTPLLVGFLLGKDGGLYTFEMDGVQWLAGSLIDGVAPGLKEVRTDHIPSKAAWSLNGAWDGFGFVGQAVGPVSVVMWDGLVFGLRADEFVANTQFLGAKWFDEVLTVIPKDPLTPHPPDDAWPHGYLTLHGYVIDGYLGGPIEDAVVWEGWTGARTDANGYYIHNKVRDIRHLCPDGWGIVCNHDDYKQEVQYIYHAAGEIVRLDWVLYPR